MKKFFIGLISVIALIVLLIGGKTYMANREMQNIVSSEKVKITIENMLKELDEKALTPEGKIKSYKIDESYTKRNPMGGIIINVVVNENEKLYFGTTISNNNNNNSYELGAISFSPELYKLIYDEK